MITKEQIEKWYSDSDGDPWGTNQPFVADRLTKSLEFIQRFVEPDFAGTFVEMGAFDGGFTVQLAPLFPRSQVVANDISETAIAKARQRAGGFGNVSFDASSIADFRALPDLASPVILLMMEMFYYTPHGQREAVLGHLLSRVPTTSVFISGPIQGEAYLKEDILLAMFGRNGFKLAAIRTLNATEEFLESIAWQNDWLLPIIGKFRPRRFRHKFNVMRLVYLERRRLALTARLDTDAKFRRKYGRQVMYLFRKVSHRN